ncbi:MAG TPA: hypothetical protein VL400_26270 [Polyangiaceae bacterium]|nr:hypothetical protein [Polyangiaceae bacterium]
MKRLAGVVWLGLAASGCSGPVGRTSALDPTAFIEAHEKIAALRDHALVARTENVRLSLDAPYLEGALASRGAVAISPPGSLRMILLGPGGGTAMDLWVADERFRFAIPAADRVVTGALTDPPSARRGLPVDFLRWWLLDPLAGELLAARRERGALVAVLREPERTTEITFHADGRVAAHRWTWRGEGADLVDEEWVTATKLGCGEVRYRDRATKIEVLATCESTRPGAAARAFEPPEGP